jgi:hypothetical protein
LTSRKVGDIPTLSVKVPHGDKNDEDFIVNSTLAVTLIGFILVTISFIIKSKEPIKLD